MIVQARIRDNPKLESVLMFVAGRQSSLESARALLSCTNGPEGYLLFPHMSPRSKKRLRRRTEPCAGCNRKFTPTGYWQHLRQTTKPECIAIRDAEARYRPLPSNDSASHSASPSVSSSPSPSVSSRQPEDDEQGPDVPPQPFEGDYYGDYQADDFNDFDEFDAAMDVEPGDPGNNADEDGLGGGLGKDNGGAEAGGGEADGAGSGRGEDGGIAGVAVGLREDDSVVKVGGDREGENNAWRARSIEDDEDDEEKEEEEEEAEEDADVFEEEDAWEPPPLIHPPFNAGLNQDNNPDPDRGEDGPSVASSASRQRAQEGLFRKTFIVPFPGCHAGAPTPCASTSSYDQYQREVDTHGRNPYAPFRSAVDWKVAHWAKMRGPGSTAVTELLQIEEVSDLNHGILHSP